MKANPGLKDKALEGRLKEQDWDASVKSLCGFPDVLKQMDENLDWTQDLGDAFLAQKTELMDTVQRMRGKAYDSGNLKTTEQQVVTQQPDKIIVIQPADPEVIYVPTYSPTVVYGRGLTRPTTIRRCITRRRTAMARWRLPRAWSGARRSGAGATGAGATAMSISTSTGRTISTATRTSTAAGTTSIATTGPGGQAVVAARCLAPWRRQLPRQQDRAAVRREHQLESRLARPGARLRPRGRRQQHVCGSARPQRFDWRHWRS